MRKTYGLTMKENTMAKDITVDETVATPAPKADKCTDCTGYCQVCGAHKPAA